MTTGLDSQDRTAPVTETLTPLVAAAVGAVVAVAGLALGWRGTDLPAQLYRVELWSRTGFHLWDSQWFGGHWLLSYSVVVPALAASVGTGVVTVGAATVATACFARLVAGRLPGAVPASLAFALGVAVEVAIGQLTFLTGEAVGLACVLAMVQRRWTTAAVAAVVTSLCSPLDGAFVALAAAALAVGAAPGDRWRSIPSIRRGPTVVFVAVVLPVAALSLAFPGDGPMPYPFVDWGWEVAVAAGAWVAVGPHRPALRRGVAIYGVALTASECVASPLGGNVGRLEDVVALPLVIGVLWGRRLLAVLAVPLILSQWSPAWSAMTTAGSQAWTHPAYYRPLVDWVRAAGGPAGRVEVVPTVEHYETAYVAPTVALARGWERQLDEADAAVFYRPGALDDASYREWLVDNGVRWVALSTAPPDSAGRGEARLLDAGVPGLRPVWSDADWRVWAVTASGGIAGPGARVVSAAGGRVTVEVARAGPVLVRERWTPAWRVVAGRATVREAPGGWLSVAAGAPGRVTLLVGRPRL